MASIIKADNIQKVSDGTNIIKKCGSTTTIGSGACSPIVICGSTVTLGRTGGTVQLACGATQSGFGQTYSATSYCTTVKTAPFTAVAGKGYFVNTTCAAVTVTLPATPTAGDVISLKDYGNTWQTNNLTICNNGNNINGVSSISTLGTKGQSVTLIYVDGTKGWQDIQDSTSNVSAGYSYNVEYLVVAGGGGATGPSCYGGGGGGAGGFRTAACFPVSSLSGPYTVTVGAGGAGRGPSFGPVSKGNDSVFSSITSAAGGGAAGQGLTGPVCNHKGGSGGGSGGGPCLPTGQAGGAGNFPAVSPPQGNPGGLGYVVTGNVVSGGGGGAGGAGVGYPLPSNSGGNGGVGAPTGIFGTSPAAALYGTPGPNPGKYFAGGGAGRGGYSGNTGTAGCGGAGGGGGTPSATSGTVNTGGGGGADRLGTGGSGGSGIVAIKYVTTCASPTASGGTAYTCGSYTIRVFTADGTFTA